MFPIPVGLTEKIVMGVAVAAVLFLGGAYWQHGRDAEKYNKLSKEFATFKGGVEGAGRERIAANQRQALAEFKAKEQADEEQKRRAAAGRARIVELRNASPVGGTLAAAPSGSLCPQGLACFDADALERAYRDFVAEVRRLADEGAAIEDALRVAREWQRGVAP